MKSAPVLFLVCLISLAAKSHATLIVNGGFEAPIITAGSGAVSYPGGSTAITGWTVTGNDVVHVSNAHVESGPLTFNSQEGLQHVDVTGGGNTGFNDGIFQDVPTIINEQYTLTYWIGRANGVSPDPRYLTESTVFVGVGGVLIAPSTNAETGPLGTINWKQFSYTFTASTAIIGFFNGTQDVANGGNNFAGVDNVSMDVVPEPGTCLIFGVAVLALTRRR